MHTLCNTPLKQFTTYTGTFSDHKVAKHYTLDLHLSVRELAADQIESEW